MQPMADAGAQLLFHGVASGVGSTGGQF
jgi:hypothetical protein